MAIRFGPFDPLQLIFEIMNNLMKKGFLSYEEALEIIEKSLPPEMPEEEKKALLKTLVKKVKEK